MPEVGDPIPVSIQLFDGDTSKFVRAKVRDATGANLVGSPVAVPHIEGGLYEVTTFLMPDSPHVTVIAEIFNDALFTIKSDDHSDTIDTFLKTFPIDIDSDAIVSLILRSLGGSITGIIEDEVLIGEIIQEDVLQGAVDEDDPIGGEVSESIVQGAIIEDEIIIGGVECP